MRTRWVGRTLAAGVAVALGATGTAAPAAAPAAATAMAAPMVADAATATSPTTTRISSDTTGAPAVGHSNQAAVSAGGRFVTFNSRATTLVAGDVNGQPDIFLRDRRTGRTELISVNSAEGQGDGESYGAAQVTPSGRHVTFMSYASNLVADDTNGVWDVFVRDRRAGTTRRVSVSSGGVQGNSSSQTPYITANGRFVTFSTAASNLVSGDTNGKRDVFVRDLAAGKTRRVSVSPDGRQSNGDSDVAGISADGRYVGFVSTATNLGPRVSTESNAFVKDLKTGAVELVNVPPAGVRFEDVEIEMSMSANGRRIAFNATPTTGSGMTQTYARDLDRRRTTLVSVNVNGTDSNGVSSHGWISPNGRYVGFVSAAHDLPAGYQFFNNVFVRDLQASTTFQASLTTAGLSPGDWVGIGGIANTGITFATGASNMTPDATGVTTSQVYLRTF